MTFTQIEYILAVAKEQSFRGAAQSRFVSQPTLSMQIQKLEDELEVLIFDRSVSPIAPTKIGELIIEQAKIAYHEMMKIPELIQYQKHGLIGELNIGIIPTISPYLVPFFLKSFTNKFPQVELKISELTTRACLKQLEREELDVVIIATKEDQKRFAQEQLYEEEFFLFAQKNHKLLAKKQLWIHDISIHDLWLLEEGHCLSDQIINTCQLRDDISQLPGHLNFKIGNLESLRLLVQENFGYTLLPSLSTVKLPPKEKKLLRTFAGTRPKRMVYLTQRRGYLKQALVKALKTEIFRIRPSIHTWAVGSPSLLGSALQYNEF